nr:uncharacterized protein LOC108083524 [Drosophila kikkawai]
MSHISQTGINESDILSIIKSPESDNTKIALCDSLNLATCRAENCKLRLKLAECEAMIRTLLQGQRQGHEIGGGTLPDQMDLDSDDGSPSLRAISSPLSISNTGLDTEFYFPLSEYGMFSSLEYSWRHIDVLPPIEETDEDDD